jgi:membrane dipeptidase
VVHCTLPRPAGRAVLDRHRYITHIERMIEVVGVDHVGVGTDMDGISPPAFLAYDDYGDWPTIGAALLARGRSREDVVKVLGGNFRRVFEDVTAV